MNTQGSIAGIQTGRSRSSEMPSTLPLNQLPYLLFNSNSKHLQSRQARRPSGAVKGVSEVPDCSSDVMIPLDTSSLQVSNFSLPRAVLKMTAQGDTKKSVKWA